MQNMIQFANGKAQELLCCIKEYSNDPTNAEYSTAFVSKLSDLTSNDLRAISPISGDTLLHKVLYWPFSKQIFNQHTQKCAKFMLEKLVERIIATDINALPDLFMHKNKMLQTALNLAFLTQNMDILAIYAGRLQNLSSQNKLFATMYTNLFIASDHHNESLLHAALRSNNMQIFNLFLAKLTFLLNTNAITITEYSSIFTRMSASGFSPLGDALKLGNIAIFNRYLENLKVILNANRYSKILFALNTEHSTLLSQAFQAKNPDTLSTYLFVIQSLVTDGCMTATDVAAFLVQRNHHEYTPLHQALIVATPEMLGMYLDAVKQSISHLTQTEQQAQYRKLFLDRTSTNMTPLWVAFTTNNNNIDNLKCYIKILKQYIKQEIITVAEYVAMLHDTDQNGLSLSEYMCKFGDADKYALHSAEIQAHRIPEKQYNQFFASTCAKISEDDDQFKSKHALNADL